MHFGCLTGTVMAWSPLRSSSWPWTTWASPWLTMRLGLWSRPLTWTATAGSTLRSLPGLCSRVFSREGVALPTTTLPPPDRLPPATTDRPPAHPARTGMESVSEIRVRVWISLKFVQTDNSVMGEWRDFSTWPLNSTLLVKRVKNHASPNETVILTSQLPEHNYCVVNFEVMWKLHEFHHVVRRPAMLGLLKSTWANISKKSVEKDQTCSNLSVYCIKA